MVYVDPAESVVTSTTPDLVTTSPSEFVNVQVVVKYVKSLEERVVGALEDLIPELFPLFEDTTRALELDQFVLKTSVDSLEVEDWKVDELPSRLEPEEDDCTSEEVLTVEPSVEAGLENEDSDSVSLEVVTVYSDEVLDELESARKSLEMSVDEELPVLTTPLELFIVSLVVVS